MEKEKLCIMASAISIQEEQSVEKSDVFMLVRFRLLDDRPNLNRQGVTVAFINDMMSRKDSLVGLPLYCDVSRLLDHDYEHLGHMYDDKTGLFQSTQIGSMTSFELTVENGITAMITTAKIPKRECEICECLSQLYEMDALKFSFQISYNPEFVVVRDGITYVDACPDNSLTGVAVVSTPANPNSYALQMVAEKTAETDEGVEKEMEQEQMEKAIAEAVAAKEAEMEKALAEKDAVIAQREAEIAELNKAIAENPFAKKEEENQEEAKAEAEDKKDEACAAAEDKKDDACAEADPEKEGMKAEIDQLKAQLAEAEKIKAEYETMKAEKEAKELAENQAMAKSFAEKQGLDPEDEKVAKAIAEVDYKMIAELTMTYVKDEKKDMNLLASFAGHGFQIGSGWDDMLAPAEK